MLSTGLNISGLDNIVPFLVNTNLAVSSIIFTSKKKFLECAYVLFVLLFPVGEKIVTN